MTAAIQSIGMADATRLHVGVVHDWLTTYVGGERVVEQIINLYPECDVLASIDILPLSQRAFLRGKKPITSFVQRIPFARRRYRTLLPLLMLGIEQLDMSKYDLVLSSSSSIAKGVLTSPDQLHISYVHSPMRYAWDLQWQYLRDAGLESGIRGRCAQWILHWARMWDQRTANGVDHFIANSQFIARRIWKTYRRESTVIYPPVDTDAFQCHEKKENFYLAASRLVAYKKIAEIVKAFELLPDRRLIVIGEGPEMPKIKAVAGRNVEILGYQPFSALRDYMQRATALIFAAEEDFGITPVEAQACGTPVIAFGRGGVLETVRGHDSTVPTGRFFSNQSAEAIAAAVQKFESGPSISPEACRVNALRFSVSNFRERYGAFVQACWNQFTIEGRSVRSRVGSVGAG